MLTSLRTRIGLLFLVFFALVSIFITATSWIVETQQHDALVINLAGRQRMLIQQMTKETLQLEAQHDTEHILALQETISIFEQTLWALTNGGTAPYLAHQSVDISPPQNASILTKLHTVQQTWEIFRSNLNQAILAEANQAKFKDALQAILELSPQLLQQADEVVRLYEIDSARKSTRLWWLQIIFFSSTLLLLLSGFILVQKSIIRPLSDLSLVTQQIGQGDLNSPVKVNGASEIVSLGQSFDTMRLELANSQSKLTMWAEDLEKRVNQRTRELTALHEVSREISSRLDIDHVLRSVVDKARELLGAEVAFLCLLDESGTVLNLGTHSGPPEALSQVQTSAQRSPATEILLGHHALPCGHGSCSGTCGIVTGSYRVSHLAAPLRVGQLTIGALCVGSSQGQFFPHEASALLTKLSNFAAIALENARLYEQSERLAMLEERQRIAAEMHDGLAQTLNYLKLKSEQISELVEVGQSVKAAVELERLYQSLDQASLEVRQAITNLQTTPSPPVNLQNKLLHLVNEFNQEGQPLTELVTRLNNSVQLPIAHMEQVLRVVREAMLNARHHAQADHVQVTLMQQNLNLVVLIEDNGQGFDPLIAPQDNRAHFGLSIMQARANRLGGQININSQPGHGTQVALSWPLNQN